MNREIANYYFKPAPFWDNIPDTCYKEFKANSILIKVEKNGIIYSEGNYPKGLYILNKGIARMYLINSIGEEQTVYLLGAGEVFGHRPLVCNDESPVFISAVEACEIEMIDKDVFLNSLKQSIELNTLILNYFGNEFKVLCNKISFFALKPVDERIALALLVLNQKFHASGQEPNIVYFSRRIVANFAGTIVETLSRQLRKMKQAGIIAIKGRKIILLDMEELYKRANI